MSKNPAWNAYNEKVREINETYERSVRPIRTQLGAELAKLEKRIQPKIDALVIERSTLSGELKDAYAKDVAAAATAQREAIRVAHNVLEAELKAAKEAKALDALPA